MIWPQISSALMRDLIVSGLTPCLASFSVKSFGVARMRRAMLAKALSTSLSMPSMLKRRSNWIFSFSLISSSTTSLARRRLVGAELDELGALLDVELRDRIAVDDDDGLRAGAGRHRDRSCDRERGGDHQAAQRKARDCIILSSSSSSTASLCVRRRRPAAVGAKPPDRYSPLPELPTPWLTRCRPACAESSAA